MFYPSPEQHIFLDIISAQIHRQMTMLFKMKRLNFILFQQPRPALTQGVFLYDIVFCNCVLIHKRLCSTDIFIHILV